MVRQNNTGSPKLDNTQKYDAVRRFRPLKYAIERDGSVDSIAERWHGREAKHLRVRARERFHNEIENQFDWSDVIGNCLVEIDVDGIVKSRGHRHQFESVTLYTLIGPESKPAIIRGILVNGIIRPKTLFWAYQLQWPDTLADKLGLQSSDFRQRGMTLRTISKKMRRCFA